MLSMFPRMIRPPTGGTGFVPEVAHPDGRDLADEGSEKTDAEEGEGDGENLRPGGGGHEVAEADRGHGHDTEIERVHPTPSFHPVVETHPDGKKGKEQEANGGGVGIGAQTSPEGAEQQDNATEKADHEAGSQKNQISPALAVQLVLVSSRGSSQEA